MAAKLVRPGRFVVLVLAACGACSRSGAGHATAGPSGTAPVANPSAGAPPRAKAPAATSGTLLASRLLGRGCALDLEDLAWCWRPPLLDTNAHDTLVPKRVPELDGLRDLQSTAYFSYLLRKDGAVHVWGKRKHSRLGDVSAPRPLPSPVRVKQLAASGEVVSLLTESGEAWALVDAFVSPDPGEAGEVVSGAPELMRANVAALSSPWGTCLLAASGEALVRAGPDWVTVPGVSRAPLIADGVSTSCAPVERAIECWGSDGTQRFTLHASDAVVGLAVSAGDVYAVRADGHVEVSWAASTVPRQLVPLAGLRAVVELSPGAGTLSQPLCARFQDKTVGCWAVGEARRVGSGSPAQRLEPTLLRQNVDASQPNRATPETH